MQAMGVSGRALIYGALALWALITLVPIYWTVTTSFKTANVPVQIVGVGMFDFLHGQTGVAPNAFELHPVLSFRSRNCH